MKPLNCQNCKRVLLEIDVFNQLAIKCRRCSHFNHFERALRTNLADLASHDLLNMEKPNGTANPTNQPQSPCQKRL